MKFIFNIFMVALIWGLSTESYAKEVCFMFSAGSYRPSGGAIPRKTKISDTNGKTLLTSPFIGFRDDKSGRNIKIYAELIEFDRNYVVFTVEDPKGVNQSFRLSSDSNFYYHFGGIFPYAHDAVCADECSKSKDGWNMSFSPTSCD